MADPIEIRGFLKTGVPPGGTSQFRDWLTYARSLGDSAPPICIEILLEGLVVEQLAALICLRQLGYEAWADGYGPNLSYRYRKVGESTWTVVHPRLKDDA